MNKPSLRDIKREATAQALAKAAFVLARERGMDGFVVEDVVQQAGYSRRTFANHFSCKEEAVAMAAITFHTMEDAELVLSCLPDDISPIDALYRLLQTQFTVELLRNMRELVSLAKQHSALEPYILNVFRSLQTSALETLGELFRDRYPAEYVHVLVGALYGAILPVVDGGINVLLPGQAGADASGAVTFEQYLDTVCGYLRNGF